MTAAGVDVAGNVAEVRERIARAARRAGRDPAAVRLVAVTKTVPDDLVRMAVAAGVTDLAENRAQDLVARAPSLADAAVRWHFVGRLQRNKVRVVAPLVVRIHSVDRPELVDPLAARARGVPLLVQVNLAREAQKGGCAPEAAGALVDALRAAGLTVDGLMTVPPHGDDPRPWFEQLAVLAARLGLPELSMGMSDDYEAAVELGATYVRVGRALFGPRTGGAPVRR